MPIFCLDNAIHDKQQLMFAFHLENMLEVSSKSPFAIYSTH